MRLWAEVYDASGNRLGDGPVTALKNASIDRRLDGVGSITLSAPLSDRRARELLTNEARVRLYVEADGETRELGRGIVRSVRLAATEGGFNLIADGPDELDELKRVNTLLGRSYTATAASIVNSLVALAAGWSASVSGGTNLIGARYDGASVLKALQELVEQQGLHLRAGTAARSLEVGAFGSDSGLRIVQAERIHRGLLRNDDLALISRLDIVLDSEDVVNWVIPLGQGEGAAALSLQHSTRSSPYTIQTTTGPDGRTLYYLSDSASIASYGQIEAVKTFRQIGAVSNSDADLENAANALYDAAAYWLQRASVRLDSYRCSVKKARLTIRPGDKVRLVYKGIVYRKNRPFSFIDVDGDFWVMKATERYGLEGATLDLELASVDRQAMNEARILVGALEAIKINNLRVQTYQNRSSFVFYYQMDSTHHADVPVELSDATTALNRCKIRVITRPFRATASGAASGGGQTSSAAGDHRHRMFTFVSNANLTPGANFDTWNARIADSSNNNDNIFLWVASGGTTEIWTETASGTHTHTIDDHTHDLTYAIHDDTVNPNTVSIYIDGVDRTSALGGPWGGGGVAMDEELDITTYLVNAVGGLRQNHTVQLRCSSSQGEALVMVELVETIQAIISSN